MIVLQPAQARDDKSFCEDVQKIADAKNAEKGKQIDEYTKTEEMVVMCREKRIISKQVVERTKNDLKDDAVQNMQATWNDNFCTDEKFRNAVESGWSIIMRLKFSDGQTLNLTAACS